MTHVIIVAAILGLGPLVAVPALAQQVPAAIVADPPADKEFPAALAVVSFPSHGIDLDATLIWPAAAARRSSRPAPRPARLRGERRSRAGNSPSGLERAPVPLSRDVGRGRCVLVLIGDRGHGGGRSLPPRHGHRHEVPHRPAARGLIGHSFGGFLAGYEGSRNLDIAGIAMISAVTLAR